MIAVFLIHYGRIVVAGSQVVRITVILQCFSDVGWMKGKASDLKSPAKTISTSLLLVNKNRVCACVRVHMRTRACVCIALLILVLVLSKTSFCFSVILEW